MAMTAAERQRRHRKKNLYKKHMGRINLWIEGNAYVALENLSRHYGKTKAALIGDLLIKTQERVLEKIQHGSAEWDGYWETEHYSAQNKEKGDE